MTPDETRAFVAANHQAILIARRSGDRLHASPISCGLSEDGRVGISITETRVKTKLLRRDPRVTLCVFTPQWLGPWVQIDGTAELVPMPAALDGLKRLYRQIRGEEHPDWDDYERAMAADRRILCLVSIDG